MQVEGLEPSRSYPRQILSLLRLPFRHTCVHMNEDILSYTAVRFNAVIEYYILQKPQYLGIIEKVGFCAQNPKRLIFQLFRVFKCR